MRSKLQQFLQEIKKSFSPKEIISAALFIMPYILKQRKAYFGLLFFLFVDIFLTIAFAWNMGEMVDAVVQSNFNNLKWLITIGISLTLVSILSTFYTNYFETTSTNTIKRDLKNDLYKHVMLLPAQKTSEHHSGELITHFTNDVYNIDGLIGTSLIELIRLPLIFIVAFIYLTNLSWQLTLVCVLASPIAAILGAFFSLILRRNSRKTHKLYSDMNTLLNESFQGLPVIRSFTLENIFHKKYKKQNTELYLLELENTRIRGWFYSVSQALSSIAYFVSLSLGAYFVATQHITIGSLIIFLNLMGYLINPLSGIAGLWAGVQHSITAVERISGVLNYIPVTSTLPEYAPSYSENNTIKFSNITFGYQEDNPLFNKLNLEIPSDSVTALVGHSGAGKSTLFNLLLQFYKPQEGEIFIDDMPISDFSFSHLRSAIALVPQESFLFDGTIKENLLIARPNITNDEMITATRHANIHEFIMSLPNGFETHIGERGVKLSGGQKQRIAIARAILKDSPILLLDEATSALDSKNEHYIRNSLGELMKGRTTIIIAHRLSTIRNADFIVVMDEGRIVQTGTHEELLNKCGVYQNLYTAKFHLEDSTFRLEPNAIVRSII